MNSLSCPTDNRKVNEKVTRWNAFFTFSAIALGLYYSNILILFFMSLDFFLRIINEGKMSPISAINKFLQKSLRIKPEMINAAPKIFAAKIGLVLTTLILISLVFQLLIPAYIIGGIIIIFALLESFFGFCIACKVYPILYRNL